MRQDAQVFAAVRYAVHARIRYQPKSLGRSTATLATGHALVQNVRRGHYELATDVSPPLRLGTAFSELALAM